MAKLVLLVGLMAVFLIVAVPNHLVNGDCCGAVRCDPNPISVLLSTCYCGDGTVSTPFCGYGQCNIFGCNCDGGCRAAPAAPAAPGSSLNGTNSQKKELQRIVAYSKSHVEQLDLNEAYNLAKSTTDGARYNGTVAEFTIIFKKADKDNNGKLTIDELNQLKP